MTIDGLTSNDLQVLLVLAAQGRALSSNELKEAGPLPTTDIRRRLEERGLITVDRSARPFLHSIDDDGWDVIADLVTSAPEVPSNPATRTLWTVLTAVGRHLARTEVGVADLFTAAAEPLADDEKPEDAATRIRAAYHGEADGPGRAVWLSELRTATGLPGDEFDAVIITLSREDGIEVFPEENRKAIPDHARAGAVTIGGQAAHHIRIR